MEVIAICAKTRSDLAKVQMIVDGIKINLIAKYKKLTYKHETYYKIFCKLGNKNRRIMVRGLFVSFSWTTGTLL